MVQAVGWKADPLVWGHGDRILEAFLEPTCPNSARAYPKLFDLLDRVGPERLTLKIRLHSQPWHMFSGVVTRAIVAASTMSEGKESAKRVLETVFAHIVDFEFKDHADGPNMDVTPNGVLKRIHEMSGVDVTEAFRITNLDLELKWLARYCRQNGVHFSPSFAIDGIVRPEFSSHDPVEKWQDALALY